jgi:hypothetical protein
MEGTRKVLPVDELWVRVIVEMLLDLAMDPKLIGTAEVTSP